MALQLVKHAILLVLRNFGAAVRVSLGPTILVIGAIMAAFFGLGINGMVLQGDVGPYFGFVVIAGIAIAFWLGWVAVAWHRYVLLEELGGFMPPVKDRPIWPYSQW